MLVCFPRRPKGPGGDILDRGGSGGMCPPSTSVEDFAAKSVRPCHMVSGVHYRYSEGWLVTASDASLLGGGVLF